ncbi:MAG: DMT family transporter [Patescibacteria group bacterium]
MWILYSIIGAFTQATEMAIKKKALQVKGMNNFIGFLAFTFAGLILGAVVLLTINENSFLIKDNFKFWEGVIATVILNVIANYSLYKALDLTELSYLMPFFAFISLSVIIPPIFLFKEIPSFQAIAGIILVIAGAILIDYRKRNSNNDNSDKEKIKNNRKGKLLFIITAVCWTFSTPMTKVAVLAGSPVLVSALVNFLCGISFMLLIYLFKDSEKIKNALNNFKNNEKRNFIIAILLAGIAIAIQIVSINTALKYAPVSYVIAIKRTMPVFAFLIGFIYFKERTNILKKLIATVIMVAGAIIVGLS